MTIDKDKIENFENILSQIMTEKNKLEKLTKKVLPHHKHTTLHHTHTKSVSSHKHEQKDEQKDELNIKPSDFKNISKENIERILELLQNYVKMDKTFRLKHEALKTLYTAYIDLYNKTKSSDGNSPTPTPTIDPNQNDILKNIHVQMKDNNANLYKERLLILKKIKDTPEIDPDMKDHICNKLLIVFKKPPVSEYTQQPMLGKSNTCNSKTNSNSNGNEKITIKELDDAYLQKHNELMTVYKAYQNLFNKVLNYKDELDKYKQLPTKSNISRDHMDKLIKDQGFVMDMIDKMQDQLVSNNIISNSEKVPVHPVANHPENIGTFNNTMRDQIKNIIDRQTEIKPNDKTKIEDLLGKYKDCDSNDQFCQAGRKILLIKKM